MTLPGPDEWPGPAEDDGSDPAGSDGSGPQGDGPPIDGTGSPDSAPGDSSLPGGDLLGERVASTPEATAVVDATSGDALSYADLHARATEFLARAGSRVVPPGGRLAVLLSSPVQFAAVSFAAWRRDCAVVALDPSGEPRDVERRVGRAGADAVCCESATEPLARDARTGALPIVSVDDPTSTSVESIDEGSRGPTAPIAGGPDAERLVAFTSGTTGRPKGVRLTARNLIASAAASAARLGVAPGDRWLDPLPPHHVGGLAPFVRSTLYGTAVVAQPSFDATATARAIRERGVTCASLVPTMLRRLLDDGDWRPPDGLRFVLLGGGPIPPSLIERCGRRGVPVCPTYGTTETASQVATATPETARERPGTVGPPLGGVAVTVLDDGDPVDADETGRIVVDGPVVSPGYLDRDATAAAFDDRGFHTGDLGYRDADGNLWIEGRVDGVIVTGGENVRPARVADAIACVDGVADAAVVGISDPEWGQRVCALVERTDPSLDAEVVRDRCRDRLAPHEVPKTVAFVAAVPRTPSGTVDRERARELVASTDDGR